MKVLLVGSGGREHAIARSLNDAELYAVVDNKNPGIVELSEEIKKIDTKNTTKVADYAENKDIQIAVVGPEAPLEAGIVNQLEKRGIYCFGPKKEDARIETDKAWARNFMKKNEIEGYPNFEIFDDIQKACEYIDGKERDLAIKPKGLTGGKGVKVTGDQISKEEAKKYVREKMGEESYENFIIEDRLIGEEFTLQAFVANGEIYPMPTVQDHKRAYQGEKGPNTGGMGSYNDSGHLLPFMNEEEYEKAISIMEKTVKNLHDYKGILYGQFMLTSEGPKIVEYNARFGDPEAMNVLPILETSFLDILKGARDGSLPEIKFSEKATVCKYAVPDSYPENPEKSRGKRIDISPPDNDNSLLFYASVEQKEGKLYTTTSRSFAVVGMGNTISEAEKNAENSLTVSEGLRVRHDIGKEELINEKINRMENIRKMKDT